MDPSLIGPRSCVIGLSLHTLLHAPSHEPCIAYRKPSPPFLSCLLQPSVCDLRRADCVAYYSHNPALPHSKRVLGQLQAALAPAADAANKKPLEFELEVVESDPTPEQLRTIRGYLKLPPDSEGLSAKERPLVVNWSDGVAAAGNDAPGAVLEALRQKRDSGGSSGEGQAKSGGGFFNALFN